MLNFCDFIQDYVFTTNHHLNRFPSKYGSNENVAGVVDLFHSLHLFHSFPSFFFF